MKRHLTIGTRASKLALWQSEYVEKLIYKHFPDLEITINKIKTTGDIILDKPLHSIGDKGLFTKELENALIDNNIDIAVHSLKDLQTELPENLTISAVTKRDYVEDVLIAKNNENTLNSLTKNAIIATGSIRRKAQLLHYRRDFNIANIRGNVDTRLNKLNNSDIDAIILSRAGIERLSFSHLISQIIPTDIMLPAVGQGVIALQTSKYNQFANEITSTINDLKTYTEIIAERSFLQALGGGCHNPIAAYAKIQDELLELEGLVSDPDGIKIIRQKGTFDKNHPQSAGAKLAELLIEQGANEILRL